MHIFQVSAASLLRCQRRFLNILSKFPLYNALASNQIKELRQKLYETWSTASRYYCKSPLSHLSLWENVNCHSNESSYPTHNYSSPQSKDVVCEI